MWEVRRTHDFDQWLRKLADGRGRTRIVMRLERLARGNPGDTKPVGGGLFELRISTGPGYRVYYLREAKALVLLLCGGDKSTQTRDIATARMLADRWRYDHQDGTS
ncbi:MAG: type II toxin-antitoxin system RelE/ParE family toxin [Acidipropionibacterium sp.]|jgi:putative addiction module killer protein|nr:type II toxin-antitoxin system RelE/ParE family toxin [Acidipropionibacterium sp.]